MSGKEHRSLLAQERVRDYFRVKARQLLASSALAACEHGGLAGSHREELQRIYLSEVLPRRFEVGRGMVYGALHRSREADIVIWDSQNFPSLPMLDHAFYFAESARAVIESKSRWSQEDFTDVLDKSRAVRDIVPMSQPTLDDALAMLQLDVWSLREGVSHHGILRSSPHIGTAAVFLRGGRRAFTVPALVPPELAAEADDQWPDLLLLLEPGVLVVKEYSEESGGRLLFFDYGEDALLAFTNGLLRLLADRAVLTEGEFYLEQYALGVLGQEPYGAVAFPMTRLLPSRRPVWE